jgi:hypothetical protein
LAATACAPAVGLGRADTLPAGDSRFAWGIDLSLVSPRVAEGDPVNVPYGLLLLGYARGLTDDVELGARLWGAGLLGSGAWGTAVDGKWRVMRADAAAHERWDAVLTGTLGYHELVIGGTREWIPFASVGALFGWRFGERHQLVFGPHVRGGLWMGDGQGTIELFGAGASVGVSLRFGRWEIFPELALTLSPIGFNGEAETSDKTGVSVTTLGLVAGYRF